MFHVERNLEDQWPAHDRLHYEVKGVVNQKQIAVCPKVIQHNIPNEVEDTEHNGPDEPWSAYKHKVKDPSEVLQVFVPFVISFSPVITIREDVFGQGIDIMLNIFLDAFKRFVDGLDKFLNLIFYLQDRFRCQVLIDLIKHIFVFSWTSSAADSMFKSTKEILDLFWLGWIIFNFHSFFLFFEIFSHLFPVLFFYFIVLIHYLLFLFVCKVTHHIFEQIFLSWLNVGFDDGVFEQAKAVMVEFKLRS